MLSLKLLFLFSEIPHKFQRKLGIVPQVCTDLFTCFSHQ